MITSGAPSLADIAAVTRNNEDGFGGGNGWWILIILFAIFGGWGNGYGNGGTNAALTRGDLCMDMNFQDLQNGVRNVNDAVSLGFANLNSTICSQQYDTARMIDGVSNQLAQCCCDTRQAIAETNYNIATQACAITNQIQNSTRDIVDATNAGTQAILTQMCNDKIAALESENAALRLSASQTAQNEYLIAQLGRKAPEPAFVVPNPFTGQYGYGCGCQQNFGCCNAVA